MKSSRVTIKDRFEKRSLPNLLVHKFLTEYGYDHGPVIARAIVEDILTTIERCYPDRIPPKTVVSAILNMAPWYNEGDGIIDRRTLR